MDYLCSARAGWVDWFLASGPGTKSTFDLSNNSFLTKLFVVVVVYRATLWLLRGVVSKPLFLVLMLKSRTSTVRWPFSLKFFLTAGQRMFVTPCYIFKKETCRQFHVVRSTDLYWFDSGIYMIDRTRLELHVVVSQSNIWLESGYNISPQWIANLLKFWNLLIE